MEADDEDFIFFGTPIEREEEMTSRKRKASADAAGQLRSLPAWKQEVTDAEGRRRFHGAFTGGFSAGYYNTVGSKEGWAPQTFTSSRKNRAEVKEQSVYSFLDDDEKAEMEGILGTSSQFDTFGFTAAELARKQAEKEQSKRPSAIPGPVPDEIVLPVANSIGVKLLLKMGWRHGHSIKDPRANSLYDARREARKAFLAFSCDDGRPQLDKCEPIKSDSENVMERSNDDDVSVSRSTPVYVLNPKQDLHGLGYDPFKHAPEFRERKRLQASGNKESRNRSVVSKLLASKSGKAAPGFGIGALEEYDDEDEDIYASAYGDLRRRWMVLSSGVQESLVDDVGKKQGDESFEFEETYVEEDEEPSKVSKNNKLLLSKKEQGVLSGFKVASSSEYQLERFNPPVIPPDFEPHHKFPASLEVQNEIIEPPPLEVSPPEDGNLRLLIEGFASLVARCGELFEDISKEKNRNNPLFSFLTGGSGHDFYKRKLWEERQKRADRRKQQLDMKSLPSMQKMTAESRGRILGERPLERSSKDSSSSAEVNHLQYNLSDTFMKPASLVESLKAAKPFKNDPAKQERFEQFLRDKYQGGLRSTYSGGSSHMSEVDRARERLDFEAAAEAIEKAKTITAANPPANQQLMEILATGKGQFISGGIEQNKVPQNEEKIEKKYPQREEYQWRPAPILCKRFDIIDPFMGKPPPMPRARSKMDTFIFMPDFVKTTTTEETADVEHSLPVSLRQMQDVDEQSSGKETENGSKTTSVERPVDLYKAIFSDDSDEEEDKDGDNQVDDSEKKNEAVNTTLNRFIAGDFLESLGKELGLEVPQDARYHIDKINTFDSQKGANNTEDIKNSSGNNRTTSTLKHDISEDIEAADGKLIYPETTRDVASSSINCDEEHDTDRNQPGKEDSWSRPGNVASESKAIVGGHLEHKSDSVKKEKMSPEDKRHKARSRRHQSTSASGTDSSDDDRHRDRSSRWKSRKHSRRHSHRSRESPVRSSHHRSGRDFEEDRRERRKSRDRGRDSGSSKSKSHSKYH